VTPPPPNPQCRITEGSAATSNSRSSSQTTSFPGHTLNQQ
jgi:hypothetical protein